MATCVEKTVQGGDVSVTGRQVVKEAESTGVNVSATVAVAIGPIRVRNYGRKQFHYHNTGSLTHTIKVYHSPVKNMPVDTSSTDWVEIYSTTVLTGAWSNPLVFLNDYEWLMMTVTASGSDTGAGNTYFRASRGMG